MAEQPKKLTPLQERFVEEYLKDLNGTAAYKRASPKANDSTARSEASKLLAQENIQVAVANAKAARSARTKVTIDQVVRELARIAFFDIRKVYGPQNQLLDVAQMPKAVARALASVQTTEEVEVIDEENQVKRVTRTHKVKPVGKLRALELLLSHLGDNGDPEDVDSITVTIEDYTSEGEP